MSTALVWFRRDLRLADNPALAAATDRHERVVCVYVHDPDAEAPWAPGGASRWWLHHALAALDASLRERGGGLVIRQGPASTRIRSLVKECGADAVYWNRLYDPGYVERDRHIKEALREDGRIAESFNGAVLVEPHSIRTGAGEPYRVFTPFWRTAQARLQQELESGRAPLPAPRQFTALDRAPASTPLEELGLLPRVRWDREFDAAWTPGEEGAHARLERFARKALAQYRQGRDQPAIDATSGLSPALHFGEISPLQLVARLQRLTAHGAPTGVQANAEWFVRELGWREFAHHLLFHFPRTPETPLVEKFAAMPWRPLREYAADLIAWQRGLTGVPIVDAGMRQLWRTGWMHNRVRMIVASFLTKNLLIPWIEGARWFWDTLVDASLANNTMGWQWTAGCGADASPFYRIFNPVLQSGKFDAPGVYLRRWVPELARLPDAAIHAPWQADAAVLSKAGLTLGRDYPQPIVDLASSRARALAAYEQVKAA
ncbi:MAG: deoxyribodipyrimidine photo-lyase [Panacagrimonas sp.]|jgi:deoxyribodipyrimidine photo-lyase|nr:deoxyribodipyrimidine photo-lyase [Panacagrimonas sp.]MCC2657391.1 deoxyribodipyrimidine photo-lyase [Panacagrimonas sp.]